MARNVKLTKEEREIEKSLERGEWKSAPKGEAARSVRSARAFVRTAKKEGRINIRIAGKDLALIKESAESEGLPYQTFMTSILHKFVTGQLVERKVIEELKHFAGKSRGKHALNG